MKIYKTLTAILLSTVVLSTSCVESFLEEDPSHLGTAETYFPTSKGFEGAVNACYASLRMINNNRHLWLLGTDQWSGQNGYPYALAPGNYADIDTYSPTGLNADNGDIKNHWDRCYIGIDRCNRALSLSKEADVSNDIKTKRIAELKTLRSLYYYWLVEQFGPVPFPLEPYKELQTTAERISEEVIYKQLIEDLTAAIGDLPEKPDHAGRITKGAARMLLAKLYLTRGYRTYGSAADFTQAAKYADDVINSGTYSLVPDPKNIFQPGNEKNPEMILSVQWTLDKTLAKWDWSTGTNDWGNNAHSKMGIAYDNFPGQMRSNYYNRGLRTYNETFHIQDCYGVDTLIQKGASYVPKPLFEALSSFPDHCSFKIDRRYNAWLLRFYISEMTRTNMATINVGYYPFTTTSVSGGTGIANGGVNNVQYTSSHYINTNWWTESGRDTCLYIPAPDEWREWPVERWINMRYGVLPRQLWFENPNGEVAMKFKNHSPAFYLFDNNKMEPKSVWYHVDWKQVRPVFFKFWEPQSAYGDNFGVRDLPLMRLSEAYLIAAEAYLKAGNSATAAERINVVRRRACDPAYGQDYMDVKPGDVTIDLVFDERTRELMGEEHRWVELKRLGFAKFKERVTKYNWWAGSPFNSNASNSTAFGGKTFLEEFHMLRPLPFSWWSLLSNKDQVPQNPGYAK